MKWLMHRILIAMLAACGGGGVRRGNPLPAQLVQPSAETFSEPRPLEDWLPARNVGQVQSTRVWPSNPYRISSQLLRTTQFSEADAYANLLAQGAQAGVDQIMVMAAGEGERVLQAHLGVFEQLWHGGGRAHAAFGFSDNTEHAMAGIGIIAAEPGTEPYAGIECQDWLPGMAELHQSDLNGAFVSRVAAGSPAEAAGLHGGELILAWSGSLGTASGGCTALNAFLRSELAADPHVFLSIWQPSMGEPLMRAIAVPAAFGPLGITVGTLEHHDVQAPFVIATDQRAEHLGFRPGDLIVAVDGSQVRWKRDLHDALDRAGFPAQSRATTVDVARFGAGRWIPLAVVALPAQRYQQEAR